MADVVARARQVIEQREAVPGQPSEGPYPASVEEVADELARFVDELDATCAPGLTLALTSRLSWMGARDRASRSLTVARVKEAVSDGYFG